MFDITKDEVFTTFMRAHERMWAATPWPGYTMSVAQAHDRWVVIAECPPLERAVLFGDKWIAIPDNRSLIQAIMNAYGRIKWYYMTGEISQG